MNDTPDHLKGPWTCVLGYPRYASFLVYDGKGNLITDDYAERKEMALLIKAAPLMLGVLEGVLPKNVCLTNPHISDDVVIPLDVTMGALRVIAATIAAAKGEK